MDASMWIAKTGLSAQSTRMSVIANNLANVNTVGSLEKDRANFEDLLYQRIVQAGAQADVLAQTPTGLMLGTGSRVVSTEKIHRQGNMVSTENALDLAISGDGFFAIQQADGTIAYMRDICSFKRSNLGALVTASGQTTIPAINLPQQAISIAGRDGTVTAELAAGGGAVQVGQLQITRFVNPAGLRAMGRNLYAESNASGPAIVGIPGDQGAGMITQVRWNNQTLMLSKKW